MKRDPVCGMEVGVTDSSLQYVYEKEGYSFCSSHCLHAFKKNPESFLGRETKKSTKGKEKAIAYGIVGAGALVVIFLTIVTLSNGSFFSALGEFKRIWYWIVLLPGGFGLQLGLFVYLKNVVREHMVAATAEVAASGTISTGSMVACCSHALVNILPILGVSAAAAFLARYQLPLLLLGVFSNLVGLTIMLGLFQRHRLLAADAIVNRVNMKTVRLVVIVSGIAAIGYSINLAG